MSEENFFNRQYPRGDPEQDTGEAVESRQQLQEGEAAQARYHLQMVKVVKIMQQVVKRVQRAQASFWGLRAFRSVLYSFAARLYVRPRSCWALFL